MDETARNKKTVTQFLHTMGEGHLDALADDALIWVAGSTAVSGRYSKAELKASFAKFKELTAEVFVVTPSSMVAESDRVAVEAASRVKMRDGRTFQCSYHYSFRLRADRIVEMHEYLDTAYIAQFFSAAN